MVERDELMQRAVASLRASRSPDPDAQARVLAGIESQLGGPPSGDGGATSDGGAAAGGSTAPVTAGWIAKVVGATAGLTASGLVVLKLGASVMRSLGGEDAVGRADEVASVEIESVDDRDDHRADADPSTTDEPELTIDEPAAAPSKPRPTTKPDAAESTDTLAAEAALLGAAKRASSPKTALALLDQHAQEFPKGTMSSEREVLAVKALCQLERTDEARTRARSLIAQRPGLPLLDRMRRDCPALADLLRQTSP